MKLHPFWTCVANAKRLAEAGCQVFQQFNCAKCGTKQTMEHPNHWHIEGKCEECGHVTNIVKDGCNYMVIASSPEAQEALWKRTQD